VCDLNDVITTHWVMNAQPTPLHLYGPRGTQKFVDATLSMLSADIGYRIGHHDDLNDGPWIEVHEVSPGDTFSVGDVDVLVGATDHRPVEPTVGFRLSTGPYSVVLAGDGIPCASLDALTAGATAYVQTVIRDDIVKMIPNQRFQDILDYHSTVAQAAETAERAAVKYLILTHYVPPPSPADESVWRELAGSYSGTTVLGDDLSSVDLASGEVSAALA
jgi:ribonuclease Z